MGFVKSSEFLVQPDVWMQLLWMHWQYRDTVEAELAPDPDGVAIASARVSLVDV